ncbi:hypothetical protein Gpo141_00014698 [Globisporangium polare]
MTDSDLNCAIFRDLHLSSSESNPPVVDLDNDEELGEVAAEEAERERSVAEERLHQRQRGYERAYRRRIQMRKHAERRAWVDEVEHD